MLLDLVYRAASTGVQGAGEALEEVLAVGHQVLYRQLLAWLLQGHLYDPHSEFFIVPEEEGEGEESILVGEEEGDVLRSREMEFYKELAKLRDSKVFSVTEF